MLRFDENTVCKSLNPREHHFYKTMPYEMREFTPQYKGENYNFYFICSTPSMARDTRICISKHSKLVCRTQQFTRILLYYLICKLFFKGFYEKLSQKYSFLQKCLCQ